jgi:hypothetical protein
LKLPNFLKENIEKISIQRQKLTTYRFCTITRELLHLIILKGSNFIFIHILSLYKEHPFHHAIVTVFPVHTPAKGDFVLKKGGIFLDFSSYRCIFAKENEKWHADDGART